MTVSSAFIGTLHAVQRDGGVDVNVVGNRARRILRRDRQSVGRKIFDMDALGV